MSGIEHEAVELERPIYSGRVLVTGSQLEEDLVNIYLHTDRHGVTTLRIESGGTGATRSLLILDKLQARNLKKCLHNGLERWEGRVP